MIKPLNISNQITNNDDCDFIEKIEWSPIVSKEAKIHGNVPILLFSQSKDAPAIMRRNRWSHVSHHNFHVIEKSNNLLFLLENKRKTNSIISETDDLGSLPFNWDGYGAIPLTPEVMENAKRFISLIPPAFIDDRTIIYPNPHGTLSFDFSNKTGFELSIEIGNSSYSYYYKNGDSLFTKDNASINDSSEMLSLLKVMFDFIKE